MTGCGASILCRIAHMCEAFPLFGFVATRSHQLGDVSNSGQLFSVVSTIMMTERSILLSLKAPGHKAKSSTRDCRNLTLSEKTPKPREGSILAGASETRVGRSPAENCARIRDLGYTVSTHINMYGEHFELVSDPFEEGDCTVVHVISGNDPTIRTLRLPESILLGLSHRSGQKTKFGKKVA
jgi:hypothetical protein